MILRIWCWVWKWFTKKYENLSISTSPRKVSRYISIITFGDTAYVLTRSIKSDSNSSTRTSYWSHSSRHWSFWRSNSLFLKRMTYSREVSVRRDQNDLELFYDRKTPVANHFHSGRPTDAVDLVLYSKDPRVPLQRQKWSRTIFTNCDYSDVLLINRDGTWSETIIFFHRVQHNDYLNRPSVPYYYDTCQRLVALLVLHSQMDPDVYDTIKLTSNKLMRISFRSDNMKKNILDDEIISRFCRIRQLRKERV